MKKRRVVITGLGIVCPVGNTIVEAWHNILNGTSGITTLENINTEGQTVTFTDNSSGGGNIITNWTWSFPGGTPSSFVGQTPPAITYASAGSYDVTLTVTNSQNTVPLTKTQYAHFPATRED